MQKLRKHRLQLQRERKQETEGKRERGRKEWRGEEEGVVGRRNC